VKGASKSALATRRDNACDAGLFAICTRSAADK
jgi:hypothetical protein